MGFRIIPMQPFTYNSGGIFPVNLSQAGNLCELMLNMTGSLTIGTPATNNVRANIGRGDAWSLIQRLDIIANGQEVLQTYTGPQLVEAARRDYGIHPRINAALGDATSGTVALNESIPVSIWTPQAKRSIDTALPANLFQSLRAQVTWNPVTSLASAVSSFGTNPTLNMSGLYNIDNFVPPYLKKIGRTTLSPTGSQTNARMDLPVGPAYHRLHINVTSSGADDATKLNNVRLVSGSTVFADVNATILQESGRYRSETPTGQLSTNASPAVTYDSALSRSSNSNIQAWYDLNLAPDGQLEQSIQTVVGGRALAEFYLEFNVSGACTIDVFSQTISANPFAPKQAA